MKGELSAFSDQLPTYGFILPSSSSCRADRRAERGCAAPPFWLTHIPHSGRARHAGMGNSTVFRSYRIGKFKTNHLKEISNSHIWETSEFQRAKAIPPGISMAGHIFDGHIFDGHIFDGHIFDGHIFDRNTFDGNTPTEISPTEITPR